MHKKISTLLYCALIGIGFVTAPVLASETNGTTSATYKYAWGENLGWVNFAPTSGGLTITDSAVTGYAWSSVGGWVNFSPANGGVTNTSEGVLGGYAWSSQKGWISMTGITINSSGRFVGTAGTQGSAAGRLNFSCDSCDVRTDWRPLSVRTSATPTPVSSGGGGGVYSPSKPAATSTATTTLPTATLIEVEQPKQEQAALSDTPWFVSEVKHTDFVRDGKIDVLDFNRLMVDWSKSGAGIAADANQDTKVDIVDFNMLMVYWGKIEVKL